MRFYLKEICDAVIDSLESPSEDFQDNIREVFCKMDEAYKITGLGDTKRAEKLSNECRYILVVLRLFPIELQLAMDNLYKKTLWGFLSIYLDFKMMLIDQQPNKETYFEDVMREIFLLLGNEDKTSIWSVVVTSHTLNRLDILKLLARRCIEVTKDVAYDHEQYIRMIWVLHVFFSQCKKSGAKTDDPAKVLETALQLKQPPGLCKWMCHHFPGFGWKGLSDSNVHETLVSEKQPRSFFKQVYQAISKDDTLKYQYQSDPASNGTREEDSSSQSEDPTTNASKKRDDSSQVKQLEMAKKSSAESEVRSDSDEPMDDETKKATAVKNDKEDENKQDPPEKSSKDNKTDDSSKKSESTSKINKTLGPRRSKPISRSSFLDDDEEDTIDVGIGGENNDTDESKQADKENKKSDAQPVDDVSSGNKDKSNKKNNKRPITETSDEDTNDSKADTSLKRRSKRSLTNQSKRETPKIASDSETDVDTPIATNNKEDKTNNSRPGKRKVDGDSDSDHTITESDTNETNNGDIDDSDVGSNGRRPTRKGKNPRSQSAVKKPQAKRMKADSSNKPSTTVELCDKDIQQSDTFRSLAYTNDEEIRKMIEEYEKGPYAHVFSDFEDAKEKKGAEPFIELAPLPAIHLETEKESTLADILHNNKQKAKEQKQPQKRIRKRRT